MWRPSLSARSFVCPDSGCGECLSLEASPLFSGRNATSRAFPSLPVRLLHTGIFLTNRRRLTGRGETLLVR
jgi:hypothetical protein